MDVENGAVALLMREPVLVREDDTLEHILKKMVNEKRNSLTVVDEHGVFVGAVNALDVIRAVLPDYLENDVITARFADATILKEDLHKEKDTPVKKFMGTELPVIKKSTSMVEATVLASKSGRGRITVVDDDKKPIGILTRTEIKCVLAAYLDLATDSK